MQELDDMRKQAQIWSDANSSEVDKLRAETELLNGQLAQRNTELGSLRERLTAVEAERDRALQEKQQVGQAGRTLVFHNSSHDSRCCGWADLSCAASLFHDGNLHMVPEAFCSAGPSSRVGS
eukprot:GHUV01057859.1.p2 GENE.GHUV01057859.1~~GHUV01057859.1.p2  ORF type:complete len:122 (-),score=35.94 GHUV01057859.1:2-367(-)